ncbi:MAG: TetR/AcrR family transcriptional regulator [Acidimicrobiales bacterium]|nr:TetR/AcrR family transcriptional regulator [Acidimicrobiales bacterium]
MTAHRGRPPKQSAEVRRALVLEVATRRFADGGRVGTSLDDIAEEAGVRKPALYVLFGAKDDLYRACVEQAVASLADSFRVVNAATAGLPRAERTRARVAATVEYAEGRPDAFRLLARAPYSWPDDDPAAGRALRDRLVEVMAANYRRESAAAGSPIDVGAEILARLFFVMAEEIVRLCLAVETTDREALVDFLAEFIDAGIAGVALGTWGAVERSRAPA